MHVKRLVSIPAAIWLAMLASQPGCTKTETPATPPPPAATVTPSIPATVPQASPTQPTSEPGWEFVEVNGSVTASGKPALKGTPIGKNDEIITGPKSSALIAVGSGSIVEVRERTQMKLGGSERRKISVQLTVGSLWSFFEKPTDYEVVTANAVAGVRGTVFFADASRKNTTFICACKGKTHIHESTEGRVAKSRAFDKEVDGHDWEHRAVAFITKGKTTVVKEFPPITEAPPKKPLTHTAQQAAQILNVLRAQPL